MNTMRFLKQKTLWLSVFMIVASLNFAQAQKPAKKTTQSGKSTKTEQPVKKAPLPSKKEILESAIGVHELTGFAGDFGPSATFGTVREGNTWRSWSQTFDGVTKLDYSVDLNDQDTALLNSMRIEVDSAMTVRFYIKGTKMIETPFMSDGMDYRVREIAREKMHEDIRLLAPQTMFLDDHLYILADDRIDYSKIIFGTFEAVGLNNILIVYSIKDKRFKVKIFTTECCNTNTFHFVKKP